jgi:tRNA A37 methylthiotransferase MiaB
VALSQADFVAANSSRDAASLAGQRNAVAKICCTVEFFWFGAELPAERWQRELVEKRMKSFYFVDKSCHRRKAEVSLLRQFFLANGWTDAPSVKAADLVLFFTCAEMRYKVANMVREVEELKTRIGKDSELIVGSCLPKTDAEALARVFHGQTITPTDFSALNELPGITIRIEELPQIYGKDAVHCSLPERTRWKGIDAIPYRLSRWVARVAPRCCPTDGMKRISANLSKSRRMTIHVSAGCNKQCSYCAIRFATGGVRSKPPDVIMQDISEGLRNGYRTFDFLSDSIGGYGTDIGSNLGELLDRVLSHPGFFTIGISDLPPQEFIRYFDRILSLCQARRIHYLYVPVQSGNERILRMMKRPCDVADLVAKFKVIHRYREVFLQTGIMVGFPGETEAEFEDTLKFLRAIGFDSVYVHYYCDMPGTLSSALPSKTDKAVMMERLDKVSRSGIRYNAAKTLIEWKSTMTIS